MSSRVEIWIGANTKQYWAKAETKDTAGNSHERKISEDRKGSRNSNLLQALIDAVKILNRPCVICVHTESSYLAEAFRQGWLASWEKNGWKNARGKNLKNGEQWKELCRALAPHSVKFSYSQSGKSEETA